MRKYIKSIGWLAVASASLIACSDDDEVKSPLNIATQYDVAAYAANTSTQTDVGNRTTKMTNEAKKGRNAANTVSSDSLNYWFTSGSTTPKSVCTNYYAGKLEGTSGYFAEIKKASGNTYTPSAPVEGGNGGVFGGYLFDENGLEMEQMIEKGLFGAVHYNHAATLLSGTYTSATPDQVMAIFGMSTTFPNSGEATKHAQPDKFMANYAARRDKNDGNGYYTQLKNNFLKLQSAIKAGDNYKTEQQEAANAIKLTWEKVNAATVINYCHAIIATMSNTTTTDAQKASALHAYGECVGFISGWRTIPQQHKKITDAQIDEILVLLKAPHDGTPMSYKFITEPVEGTIKLQEVITKMKVIYGFSNTEIEDFKKNWVSEQKR